MNIENLNKRMNCECLQCIIRKDDKRFTFDREERGIRYISKSNERGTINLFSDVSYRIKKINMKNGNILRENDGYNTNMKIGHVFMDRNESEKISIPFLFCPICGTKSKIETHPDDFYTKLQNKITQ